MKHFIILFTADLVTQLTFTCSKSAIETLEKDQHDVIDFVLVFLLLTLNIFHTFFSSVSIVDFEQVNISWETLLENVTKFF